MLPPTSEERVKSFNKRKTKKWCKGKEGVLHQGKWLSTLLVHLGEAEYRRRGYDKEQKWSWEVLVCQNCGKQLRLRNIKSS